MFKDNLYLKFVRFFYNLTDDLDEYRENQLNKFGNNMFMFLYSMIWLTFFLGVFQIDISGLVLILMIFVPIIGMDIHIRKLKLDRIEIEKKELTVAKKRMFRRTLSQTLGFIIFLTVFFIGLWNSGIPQEGADPITLETYFFTSVPITLTFMTPFIFIVCYISNRRKIKIIEDEE